MKFNMKRFLMINIPLLMILCGIFYYTNSWYSVRKVYRAAIKDTRLKDVKSERITIEQAKCIIGGNSSNVKLIEITTDEVFNKMGYQIFKGTDWRTYVVKDRWAYEIGTSSGGWGVMDFCVADLNKDDVPELIYTYSYGSGIHRTEIGMLVLGEENHQNIVKNYYIGDVFLDKVDNQCVVLRWLDFSKNGYKNEYIGSSYGLYNRKVRGEILGTLEVKDTTETNTLQVKINKVFAADKERIVCSKER